MKRSRPLPRLPRPAYLLVVGLLAACAAPPDPVFSGGGVGWDDAQRLTWVQDNWSEAQDVCWPMPDDWNVSSFPEVYGGDACAELIAQHLGLDKDSFDMDVLEQGNTYYRLMDGMYFLGFGDLGTVGDLLDDDTVAEEDYVHAPYIDTMQRLEKWLGTDQLGPLTYSLVTSMVLETRWSDQPPNDHTAASVNMSSRVVQFFMAPADEMSAAATMVHEAIHVWTDTKHVTCVDGAHIGLADYTGKKMCDEDWSGPYGHQAATMLMAYKQHGCLGDHDNDPVEGSYCDSMGFPADKALNMINAYLEQDTGG